MLPNVLVLASLLSQTLGQSTGYTFDKLENSRRFINVLPYSAQERVAVARNMVNMFSVYVNRESKIKNYGTEFPDIDPIPRIAKIAAKAANMTNLDFNTEIADLFNSLRDYHTVFNIPGIHSCLVAIRPVFFDVVWERDTPISPLRRKYVAVRFLDLSPAFKTAAPDRAKISPGDELVGIDGKNIQEYVDSQKYVSGAAGIGPSTDATIFNLVVRSGMLQPLPKENGNTFQFKSASTGETYTAYLPWMIRRDDNCVKNANRVNKLMGGEPVAETSNLVGTEFTLDLPSLPIRPRPKYVSVNPMVDLIKQIYGQRPDLALIPLTDSAEKVIKYGIHDPAGKNLGIIFIESFIPENTDDLGATLIIRNLLANELKDTNGVLFDVRENGGGSIVFANLIPQLFVQNYESAGARAIVNDVNAAVFNNPGFEDWKAALDAAKGETYSKLVRFETIEEINTLGMAYFKPVGVLTNANCYSACSLFSAGMQDFAAATIYGEDLTNGGGGANVVHWESLFARAAPAYFTAPPRFSEFKSIPGSLGAPDATLGWRQQVRVGKYAGQIIEDLNVKSEKLIPIAKSELLGARTNSQFDRIANDLMKQYSNKDKVNFRTTQDLVSETTAGANVTFDFQSQGVKSIVIQDVTGNKIAESQVDFNDIGKFKASKISFPTLSKASGFERYLVVGYNLYDERVFTTNRYGQLIPSERGKVSPGAGFKLDLTTKQAYSYQDDRGATGFGWNNTPSGLIIGDGKQYQNNIFSELKYFLTVSAASKVTINASVDTEANYDFFYFGYQLNGKEVNFLQTTSPAARSGISGKQTVAKTFDVPAGDVRLFLRFTSDSVQTATGVNVKSITFQ